MKIAIVAPSPVPFLVGGAEKLWWGLLNAINRLTPHHADLIKLPVREDGFWSLMESYRRFSQLDLDHFDLVISTKYPAWMVSHPNHICYLQHRLRGLYDTYSFTGLPTSIDAPPPPVRDLLRIMDGSGGDRSALAPFFDALFAFREDTALPPDTCAFPGPLSRHIVHFLDGIGLEPAAIKRYYAISQNVANRRDYFPVGAPVRVIHHPSDLARFETGGADFIFTASRLDGPKRVGLIIEAFRQTDTDRQLLIAGTGPAEEQMHALADGDQRIRFLGHVSDERMIELYANALFVPFLPYDEDYGLVTIEAMMSGKPVLTTTDAGGVNEFVVHGRTGLSVSPNVEQLAGAMQQLLDDPEQTATMGRAARQQTRGIDWQRTVDTLLDEGDQGDCPHGNASRMKLVVVVDFPVYPPQGGGQSRIFHLYKALAQRADVTLVTLCDDNEAGRKRIAPGLTEVRVAKSPQHLEAAGKLDQALGNSVGDIATLLYQTLTPDLARALAGETADADLVIASHPYLYPTIEQVYDGPLWYEAHNVEYDMKRAVLADVKDAGSYLDQVNATESALCDRAECVMVCANEDAVRLEALYGLDSEKVIVVPNGVDTGAVPFVTAETRRRRKTDLGLADRFCALFIGSWHQPNIEAVEALKTIAVDCPECDFFVVGSVTHHSVMDNRPANLYSLGLLEDAELSIVLGAVDLALNPTRSGSGTNLKMLHYAAAGVPILTTPFGNRGLLFQPDEHIRVAELGDFPEHIRSLLDPPDDQRDRLARNARALTEESYDWTVIADAITLERARKP